MSHRACLFIPISMSGGKPRQEAPVKSLGVSKRRHIPLFWAGLASSLEAATEEHSPFLPVHSPPSGTCPLRSASNRNRESFSISYSSDFLLELRSNSEQGSFLLGLLICWWLWTSAVTGPSCLAIPLCHSVGLPGQILLGLRCFCLHWHKAGFYGFSLTLSFVMDGLWVTLQSHAIWVPGGKLHWSQATALFVTAPGRIVLKL